MKNEPEYQPDEFEQESFRELVSKFEVLKKKHARRNLSPLKFVEAYNDFVAAHHAFEVWVWAAVEDKVKGMKDYLAVFMAKDYKNALGPAAEQEKRNELWDQFYNAPPRFYEGGKADGNSR